MAVANGIFHDFDLDGGFFKSWRKGHAMIRFLCRALPFMISSVF